MWRPCKLLYHSNLEAPNSKAGIVTNASLTSQHRAILNFLQVPKIIENFTIKCQCKKAEVVFYVARCHYKTNAWCYAVPQCIRCRRGCYEHFPLTSQKPMPHTSCFSKIPLWYQVSNSTDRLDPQDCKDVNMQYCWGREGERSPGSFSALPFELAPYRI